MSTNNYYLNYLKAGAQDLEDYLLVKALFWPIGISASPGEPSYPRLTLGNLLLTQRLVNINELSTGQSFQFELMLREFNRWKNKRKVAWVRKANHEFRSRLQQWHYYINELFQKPDQFIDYYKNEVRLRVLLDLLKDEVENLDEETFLHLGELDVIHRGVFDQGEFIEYQIMFYLHVLTGTGDLIIKLND